MVLLVIQIQCKAYSCKKPLVIGMLCVLLNPEILGYELTDLSVAKYPDPMYFLKHSGPSLTHALK